MLHNLQAAKAKRLKCERIDVFILLSETRSYNKWTRTLEPLNSMWMPSARHSSVFNIRCQPLGTFPLPAEGPTAESKHWRLMFLGESGRVPNTLTSVCDGRRRRSGEGWGGWRMGSWGSQRWMRNAFCMWRSGALRGNDRSKCNQQAQPELGGSRSLRGRQEGEAGRGCCFSSESAVQREGRAVLERSQPNVRWSVRLSCGRSSVLDGGTQSDLTVWDNEGWRFSFKIFFLAFFAQC